MATNTCNVMVGYTLKQPLSILKFQTRTYSLRAVPINLCQQFYSSNQLSNSASLAISLPFIENRCCDES